MTEDPEPELELPSTSTPLLPARMLNEFVYCPRLFHLEWVDGRWADNDDTAAGQWVHRSVDSGSGPMPGPQDTDPPLTTRSVQLSSESLGLTATIDRVDHTGGSCSPVDYKRGSPAPDGQPWPADRAQSLAQAALLEDAGYRVDDAIIYYATTHQRVHIPWTPAARVELISLVEKARRQSLAPQPPPPLVDSPKCPRCSLVSLCLPDETNTLLGEISKPRRILPRDPDCRPLYITQPGAMLSVRGGQLLVKAKNEMLAELRLIDVSHVAAFGNVQITTQALTRMWDSGITALWLSSGGWLRGWAGGPGSKHVQLRISQVQAHTAGLPFAQQMVSAKIHNQRTLLRRNVRRDLPPSLLSQLQTLAAAARSAQSTSQLLGIEGAAARLYFQNFTSMFDADHNLTSEFDQRGRSRRPPPDPLNALLGFAYSLLTKELVVVCLGVGLDPQIGVYHRPRYSRPSLALDLAEEFRALIADSVVLQVINNREVGTTDFIRRSIGTELTPIGRRKVIAAFERRLETEVKHPVFGYRISYRRVLDVQTRVLAAAMVGEIPSYTPMTTR